MQVNLYLKASPLRLKHGTKRWCFCVFAFESQYLNVTLIKITYIIDMTHFGFKNRIQREISRRLECYIN